MALQSALVAHGFERADADDAPVAFSVGDVVVSIADDLTALERDWRAFEAEADATVFQSYAWLATWQRHVGAQQGVRPAIVSARAADGRMLFLLPLAIRRRAFVRELTWLGMDLCDYAGPLLAPDFSGVVEGDKFLTMWNRVTQALAKDPRFAFDLIRLEKMPQSVGAQANPFLSLNVTRHPSGAYLTPLGDSWDAFYAATRSSATRRRDRTKRKNLAGLGELQFVESVGEPERLQTLDLLMQQKARSFARMGVSNLFAKPGHADFFRAISGEAFAHVSRLDVGAHAAAINLGLMARGRYYHLLASYTDDAEIVRFGPGAAHLMELMAYAIRRGCTIFDFTIGDEPYKLDWCDGRQELYDHRSARTPAGAVVVAMRAIAMRAKRTIKENPVLRDAFFKAREALGRLRG
jgi:CelD/BcsL family acetyltransferase involved in cellulose biosynthesis